MITETLQSPTKVYLFIRHVVTDSRDLGIIVQCFSTKEAAVTALKQWRDDEIKYVTEFNYEIVTDEPEEFFAYDGGWYACDHSIGYIEEHEIN